MLRRLFQMPVWALLLLLAVLAVAVLIIFSSLNPWNPMNLFTKPEAGVDASRTAVINQIQSLQRLETTTFTIEKIIEAGTDGNAFQEVLYGDRLLLIAHGKVVAGVDLSQLKSEDVEVSGDILTVTTPPTEVFSSFLDNSKTTVYDRQQGFLSQGDKNLETQARTAAEVSIRQAACDGDILVEAAESAEKHLAEMFSLLGYREVVVNTPVGQCT